MPKNSLCFLLALLAGIAIPLANRAKADDCEGQCYAALTYYMHCENGKGCDEELGITTCIPGCDGASCSISYGLCCGTKIQEQNTSGQCNPTGGGGPSVKLHSPALHSASNLTDYPQRAIFVPDRCGHSYGVIDVGTL